MSIDHLRTIDTGDIVVPETEREWSDWVSATRTRNHVLGDPLLDWLDLHGTPKGFKRDGELPGYDPRTDFTEFLFAQGRRFEEAVVAHLGTLHPVVTISDGPEDVRDLAKAEETFRAMQDGTPIIHQGVLRDPQHRSYGAPDLLVRSDVLAELFPGAIEAEQVADAAPDLGGPLALPRRRHQVHDAPPLGTRRAGQPGLIARLQAPALRIQPRARSAPRIRAACLAPPRSRMGATEGAWVLVHGAPRAGATVGNDRER